MAYIDDFFLFLKSHEMTPPSPIVIDKLVKYTSLEHSDRRSKSEWYLLHAFPDGHYYGVAGDFRGNKRHTYHSYSKDAPDALKRAYRAEQKLTLSKLLDLDSHKAEALIDYLKEKLEELSPLPSPIPSLWLESKGVPAKGLLWHDRLQALAIPIHDLNGAVMSLQYVFSDGSKRHIKGVPANGHHIIGSTDKMKRLIFCEGWSDAMTIHECTGETTVACFGSNNVIAQASLLRDKYSVPVALARDLGEAGDRLTEQWKEIVKGEVFTPRLKDFNEVYTQMGKDAVKTAFMPKLPIRDIKEFLDTPLQPLDWVIENYMLNRSVNVIYGMAGSGKTYYLLQKALMLATGKAFFGRLITKRKKVLYIDAELGTNLLHARLKQLSNINRIHPSDLAGWMSIYSFDFDFEYKMFLTDVKTQGMLESAIESHDVIFFDNYLKLVPVSEYDKQHVLWVRVYEWLQRIAKIEGKTVVLAHHSPKSGIGMMGASQMSNDIDFSVCLSKNPQAPPYLSIVAEFDKTRSIDPAYCSPFTCDLHQDAWYVMPGVPKKEAG